MSFFGLNIALRGLTAQRQALDVTSHNVSNANTEGYTRQEALLKASRDVGWGLTSKIGSGVVVDDVRRIRDALVDKQMRSQMASLGNWETRERYLEEVESIYNEPSDDGFNTQFSAFWGAWQDLAGNPDSYAARAELVQTGSVLADMLRRDYQQMSEIQDRVDTDLDTRIEEVNGWLEGISKLNVQIASEKGVGIDPNDLYDQRDLLLDKVSKTLKVQYEEDTNGSMTVRLNNSTGAILVQGDDFYNLRRGGALGEIQRDDGAGNWADINSEDGELKGLLDVRDTVLNPTVSNSLAFKVNELGKGIIELVNAYHSSGYSQDGTTTALDFFSGTGASDITVNSALVSDPTLVGAASVAGQPGNGNQALVIAQKLQGELGVPASVPTATIASWYDGFIAKLGVDTQQAHTMFSNQELLVNNLKTNRESNSGVSLDEEAVNLIRFQRAYQASANVMSAIDSMLEKLVNGVGLVGR